MTKKINRRKGNCTVCPRTNVTVYKHHINYEKDIMFDVCGSCHRRIHNGHHKNLMPLDMHFDYVVVRLSEQNRDRLEKDRQEFEKLIGGGKWSLNDAFTEYLKIMNSYAKREKTIKSIRCKNK